MHNKNTEELESISTSSITSGALFMLQTALLSIFTRLYMLQQFQTDMAKYCKYSFKWSKKTIQSMNSISRRLTTNCAVLFSSPSKKEVWPCHEYLRNLAPPVEMSIMQRPCRTAAHLPLSLGPANTDAQIKSAIVAGSPADSRRPCSEWRQINK